MELTKTPLSVRHKVRPRSTVTTMALTESLCEGRSLLRGRVERGGRIRISLSSGRRLAIEYFTPKSREIREGFSSGFNVFY